MIERELIADIKGALVLPKTLLTLFPERHVITNEEEIKNLADAIAAIKTIEEKLKELDSLLEEIQKEQK